MSANDLILDDYANKHSSSGSYGVIYALIGSSLRSVPGKGTLHDKSTDQAVNLACDQILL